MSAPEDQSRAGLPAFVTNAGNAERAAHLEFLRALREGRLWELVGLPWGQVALSIPMLDYAVLMRRYPDLAAPDATTQAKEWQRLARLGVLEKYKVRRSRGRL